MPATPALRTDSAWSVTADDLTPGPGLDPAGPDKWAVAAPHVRLTAAIRLEPGWYEVRLAARSADRFTLRKRLELTFDPGDANPRPVGREAFAWSRGFGEAFMLRLTRPAAGVRLDVWHAEGTLTLEQFAVRRLANAAALARAVKAKVRLTRAYHCFGPAVVRGGKLLLRGRLREFGTKLYKGLTDARVMQLGAIAVGEVDGGWSRRHALPADEAERVRMAVDAMPDPPPLAVLLPVDPGRMDAARTSAHSVRRQIYPHWQLLVAAAGPAELAPHLDGIVGPDPRVVGARVPGWMGRPAAIARVLAKAECEHVVVLPPGLELSEHALYHFAAALKRDPDAAAVGGRVYDVINTAPAGAGGNAVWLTRLRGLSDAVPADLDAKSLAGWALAGVPEDRRPVLDPVLAYPIDDRPLLDRARVGKAPKEKGRRLILAADVRGVGGYDHVAFWMLKGLPSAGADLFMHSGAGVRTDLVPAGLLRPAKPRDPDDRQLILGPPFLIARFYPDRLSAVYTMWECDRLDPATVPHLNRAGVVIVPSRWQVECFRASGVTVPMAVAPLGYDPLVYHPTGPAPEVCTFGTAGALSAGGLRKNAQWLIDLFRRAFPREPDVRLRVKISPGSPGVETYDDPRIDVIRAVLPLPELADWYRSLTVYLNGSSGEGFGLHLIEAMACGRPIVSAAFSGLTAFFDGSVGYPVDYRLVPVRNEIYNGHWAEPDAESMVAQMRRVYANRAEAARLGAVSAARAKNFTWKAAGQSLAAALREHGFLA
ncbi:MAG TPA: glycosyltransferase [Fimbriiglobus sp.]|nr:glycosyltransferase [Fimbriiglobus sp.]